VVDDDDMMMDDDDDERDKNIKFSIEYEQHYHIHKRRTLVNISIQTDEANVIIFYSLHSIIHSIIIKTRPLVTCWVHLHGK
jgi:hypothetical protein